MEVDNEVSGNGNSYTTEFRQYDPRLGRWKSLDPLMAMFPWQSAYCAFDNNPIYYVDPYGLSAGPGDGPGDDEDGGTLYDEVIVTPNGAPKDPGIPQWFYDLAEGQSSVDYFANNARDNNWKNDHMISCLTGERERCMSGGPATVRNAPEGYEVVPGTTVKENSYDHSTSKAGMELMFLLMADDVTGIGVIDDVLLPFIGTVNAGIWVFESLEPVGVRTTSEIRAVPTAASTSATDTQTKDKNNPRIMYHYTNISGMTGILASQQIFPSLKANNPKDARYGDGVYWSDITPGTMNSVQLALKFIGVPNMYKYTHYVAVDVSEFPVNYARPNVYVTPTPFNLPVAGKIIMGGAVPND